MENKHQQILSEMNDLLSALKAQVEALEMKISEFQQIVENQSVVVEIIDAGEDKDDEQPDMFEMEVMDIELQPSDDLPFYDAAPIAPIAPVAAEPADNAPAAAEPAAAVQAVAEPVILNEAKDFAGQPAMIDAMTAKQAWRTDMPGSPVKDIRSAISLNDRILFINYLFGEDPIEFQNMLTQLNAMSSFAEAADHIIAANPDWDLESDTVYRFMMAIRRRLQ